MNSLKHERSVGNTSCSWQHWLTGISLMDLLRSDGLVLLSNTYDANNPLTDPWQYEPADTAPTPWRRHTAIRTGRAMIIWGGSTPAVTNTGGLYSPLFNVWQPTTIVNAPEARLNHTAVWNGSRMIIWDGVGISYKNWCFI